MITKEQVATAVANLRTEGRTPSSRAILGVLGGGSLTTIQNHIRAIMADEASQAAAAKALPLDTTVKSWVESLATPLHSVIETIVSQSLEPAQVEIARLQAELDDILTYNESLVKQAQEAAAERDKIMTLRDAERADQMAAERRAGAAETKAAVIETRALAAEKRVAELEAELAKKK